MSSPTYKALLFYGPGQIRIVDVPFPELADGEALVKIGAATTCGTDIKTFKRGHPVIIKSIPSPIGHEMAGTVTKISASVINIKVGDRVVVGNSAPCGICFYCQKNQPNLCDDIVFLNGGFAEYIRVPKRIVAKNLHPIPDSLSFEVAALSEPLACVIHACEQMGIIKGETVAVIGTGPMAFLFIDVIRERGGQTIIVGRNLERLKLAREFGAIAAIQSTNEDPIAAVKSLTSGRGADVAIEAVGQPTTWEQAVGLVRKGGRICLYGGCARGTTMALDTYRIHYEEITVSGIFHHTPDMFRRAVTLLSNGKIHTDIFLREKRGLGDLEKILSSQDDPMALKFAIRP